MSGCFVTRVSIDGRQVLVGEKDLCQGIKEFLNSKGAFSVLTMARPSDDACMEISTAEKSYVVSGAEDSKRRGSFCFALLNGTEDDNVVDDVEGLREYSTISEMADMVRIAQLYIYSGDLHAGFLWHVSRVGNGQEHRDIPEHEKFGGDDAASFGSFLDRLK